MSGATDSTGIGFVPASLGAVSPERTIGERVRNGDNPVRLRFKPFGNRLVGDPDAVPGYQVLDGRASVVTFDGERVLYMTDVSGRELILAPGRRFLPQNPDLPEWAVEELSLSNHSRVLGVPKRGGEGYVAVGTDVEILIPE